MFVKIPPTKFGKTDEVRKSNQGNLPEQIVDSFRFLRPVSSDEQTDAGYGRVETRRCQVINNLSLIEQVGEWEGCNAL